MVRFSHIIGTENKSIRKRSTTERDLSAEQPTENGGKSAAATDTRDAVRGFSPDRGNGEIGALYTRLSEKTIDIRDRIAKNLEIEPSSILGIFRHILEDRTIDDLYQYTLSIPDDFGPPSRILSITLAHLKMGKELGYDTDKLLKSGLAALLQHIDMAELPDSILQEGCVLSPDDVAAIKKYPGPFLDILAHLSKDTPNGPRAFTDDRKSPPNPKLLGIIPHEDEEGIRKSMENEGRRVAPGSSLLQNIHLVSHFAHQSALAASFRALRTNLLFLGLGEDIKTLAVSSLLQGEGKTTVAANLAITLAQAGMKTLLAGADLRKPFAEKSLASDIRPGLTDVLLENYSWRDVIMTLSDVMVQEDGNISTELDNLHIITSGSVAIRSSELVNSSRLIYFIKETRKAYDSVILDLSFTPSTPDPLVLGSKVDAILLVSRKENLSEDLQREAAAPMALSNGNVIGLVLNNVKKRGARGLLYPHNTESEQEATDKMEEPENAYKELAEISTEKKTGPVKLWPALIVLALIVFGAVWLSGILTNDRPQDTVKTTAKETSPALHKEKITQPIKVSEHTPTPEKGASSPSDGELVPKEDKPLLSEKKPAEAMEETKPVPIAATPSPSPPHQVLKSDAETPSGTTVSYPFSLHMGSYESSGLAEKYMAELTEKGFSPYWTRVDLGAKGVWYRVFVGHFETADKADRFQETHGIKADRILRTAYAVQIGFYQSMEEVSRKISTLRRMGQFPYYIEQSQNRYQLLIGAYQTKKAAEELAVKTKKSGLDCEMILR